VKLLFWMILALLGAALLFYGLWLAWKPLAYVAAGLILLFIAEKKGS
jgi:hypothetical protein